MYKYSLSAVKQNCYNTKVNKKAFTIIEIIIAIAVILILATAALSGSGGIIRSMRFNNAFNKMILMVQRAKSLATSGKKTDVKSYKVEFLLEEGTVNLIADAGTVETMDTLELEQTSLLKLTSPSCGNATTYSAIIFNNQTNEIELKCSNAPNATNESLLKISLEEKDADGNSVREKTFSINHLSGLPQL